jgi:Gene product 88
MTTQAQPSPILAASPRLSRTSKLFARSWSLQARETCPGSLDADGELVPACSGCYATGGQYYYPQVKTVREHNRQDWKHPGWVSAMVSELKNDQFFRWFDSGDCYSLELAQKILQVIQQTPNTRHWIPTRMHKFPKFRTILDAINAQPNAVVRFSSDSVTGEYTPGLHGSVIIPKGTEPPKGATLCNAPPMPVNAGKCRDDAGNTCRECWNKETPVIAYQSHGNKMKKVIRLTLEASTNQGV